MYLFQLVKFKIYKEKFNSLKYLDHLMIFGRILNDL